MPKPCLNETDLFRLLLPGAARVSPDGSRIAYSLKRTLEKEDRYAANLWLVPAAGGSSRRLTAGDAIDEGPAWSPDGARIAFVSNRGGKREVWIIPADGGESEKLIDLPGSTWAPDWSPDGKRIAFLYRAPDEPADGAATGGSTGLGGAGGAAPTATAPKPEPVQRHIRRPHYKEDGAGFLPLERSHVRVLDLDTRKLHATTDGPYDEGAPRWSPDGTRLVFSSNRAAEPDLAGDSSDLFLVAPEGGELTQLTRNPGPANSPVFARDGKSVAFIGHTQPADTWGVTNQHPYVVPASGGGAGEWDLVPDFDRTAWDAVISDTSDLHEITAPAFSPDGTSIYFVASDHGASDVYRVPVAGGKPVRVTEGKREVASFDLARDGSFAAVVVSEATSPGEIWRLETAGRMKRLTNHNEAFLQGERELLPVEEISFRSADGPDIQGWVVHPPGFDATKKYPTILYVHGGPHVMYGYSFFHEFQYLAARGFVILYTNPRGSQGYGEAFTGSIKKDWGGPDYRDLMAAVDHLSARSYVDTGRLGVTGGSYGGYMTNWIVGHTERFRAAVTQRSVTNLVSMFGTSDMGYDTPWEFGAYPWEDPETFRRLSPITYVDKVRTPLLILHNEGDLRCSIEQAEQLFISLKVLRRDVEFIRFPKESHGLSRAGTPSRRLARLRAISGWFDRHLKEGGA